MSQASSIHNDAIGREAAGISPETGDGSAQLLGIAQGTWIRIAVVAALMTALFRFNLHRLWDKTNPFYGEANWGHAIAIPFISLYYLYVNRDELLNPGMGSRTKEALPASGGNVGILSLASRGVTQGELRSRFENIWTIVLVELSITMMLLWVWVYAPEFLTISALVVACVAILSAAGLWWSRNSNLVAKLMDGSAEWFGAYIMVYGIALFGYGIYPGQNDFVKDFGMLVTLFGVSTMLAGWARMKIAWFAVAVLVCGIPWPGLVYSTIAGPLQQLAANVAVWTLELTGVESSASGTKIIISGHGGALRTLNVAEACAGLHSLMTFITVGAAVAFLSSRSLWQKIIVTLSAIPIAIFCNVMRVAGQGLLDHYVSQQLSESFAHQFVGMIMLIPAFVLILLVGWALDQIFVEEVDRHQRVAPTVIRQQSQSAAAPVAVASGRSLASTKAAVAASGPAPAASVLRPRATLVTPPPPTTRLASRSAASARRTQPNPAASTGTPPTAGAKPPTPPETIPGKAL